MSRTIVKNPCSGIVVITLILLVLSTYDCDGSKILFYNSVATPSHNMIMHPIAVQLVEKGHQVTYLTAVKLKKEHPKINYFYPGKVIKYMTEILSGVGTDNLRETGWTNAYNQIIPLAAENCRILMQSEETHEWIDKSEFDLLIINACYNECALGLAHKFKAPYIVVQTAAFASWQADMYGIPSESHIIPDFRLNMTQNMDFWDRLFNTVYSLEMYLFKLQGYFFPLIESYIKDGLKDPKIPEINDLIKEARLVLVNSYFASEFGHTFPPFVIPVGGLHIDPNVNSSQMPKNIGDFISQFDGFIYISFGTMSRPTAELEVGLLQNLPKRFPNIGFVIKWAGEVPKNPPRNVLPVLWAPQEVLLADSKIRGFVSHGGMLSLQEASYYGVPMILMPSRADQDYNTECLVRLGVGIRLEVTGLDMKQLEEAVWTLLNDKSYRERMNSISQVYRDRPMSAMATAIWWIEFVLRNEAKGNDLSGMRPLGIHQTWWQRRLLDVWGLIFLILTLGGILILLGLKFLIRTIFGRGSKVEKGKGAKGKKVKSN